MNSTNNNNQPKRIAIYVIFDKDGILDDYRKYYLKELRKVTNRIVAVVNGALTPESRNELYELVDDFFVRENKGLLAYGWIEGIRHIGWDELYKYDELLMLNDSFFGPFYPLSELMDAAEKSDADFYGCMKNFENKQIPEMNGHKFKHGYIRGSICYFYIIKSKLLHSSEFKKYWEGTPEIIEDSDTYFFSEMAFYDYVVDCGFKVNAYQDDSLKNYFFDNLTHNMFKLVKDNRIPFARMRPFCTDMKDQSLLIGYGKDPRETLEFVKEHTDYDTGMIWDYLLRTKNLTHIYNQLQLEYVINKDVVEKPYIYSKKIGVILHIYYEDLVEKMAEYCENFPSNTDFYITTTSKKAKKVIEKEFSKRKLNYECVVRPNVGVAMSSLWVTYADLVTSGKYEYMCYFHDKKSPYSNLGEIHGEQFAKRCYDNLVGSPEVTINIINLFEDNARLGILGAPMVYHGLYYTAAPRGWSMNYANTVYLAKKLDIKANIDPNISPASAYGDMFWFRTEALKKAIGHGFTYDDFDVPYAPDGTFMHAIERIYGLAAQDAGYYYADVITNDDARSDLVNYRYMVEKMCGIMVQGGYYPYTFEETKMILRYLCNVDGTNGAGSDRLILKRIIKKHCPKFIWNGARKIYRFFGGKKWVG